MKCDKVLNALKFCKGADYYGRETEMSVSNPSFIPNQWHRKRNIIELYRCELSKENKFIININIIIIIIIIINGNNNGNKKYYLPTQKTKLLHQAFQHEK